MEYASRNLSGFACTFCDCTAKFWSTRLCCRCSMCLGLDRLVLYLLPTRTLFSSQTPWCLLWQLACICRLLDWRLSSLVYKRLCSKEQAFLQVWSLWQTRSRVDVWVYDHPAFNWHGLASRWSELSLHSCQEYRVHASLPRSRLLSMQAWYTLIL